METAEDRLHDHTVSAFHLMSGHSSRIDVGIRVGNARAEPRVWATPIAMSHPLGQDSPEMPLIERNKPIQTFTTRRPDHAFAKGVRRGVAIGVFRTRSPIAVKARSTPGA